MKARLAGSIALVIAAAACGGGGAAMQSSNAQAQMAAGCGMQLDRFQSGYCSEAAIANLSKAQAGRMIASQAASLKAQCSYHPSLAPKLQALDACMARIQGGSDAERTAQQARLPAVRAKEAEIRADPRYKPLIDAWTRADHEALVAGDNVSIARQENNPNLERYERRFDEVAAARDEAAANMRKFFESFGVAPQDAHVIGLW